MSKVGKNYLYNVTYQILVAIVPIITAPYLSRVVGTTGSGIYSYYLSIVTYFVLATKLGTQTYGSRVISTSRTDPEEMAKTFSSLVCITAGVGVAALFIYALYSKTQEQFLISALFSLEIVAAALDITWLYAGLEEFKITAIRNIIIKILNTICIFVFVRTYDDLWKYVLIVSMGTLISSLVLWLGVRKRTRLCRVSFADIRKHIYPCFLLFIPTIATSIYKSMDKILLGIMSDMDAVGLYDYAEKIPTLLLGFVGAMGVVMLPRMSSIIAQGKQKEAEELLEKTMLFIMFLACAMSFGIAGISLEFIPLFFGKEFTYSGILMMPVALTMIFTSWASIIRNLHILPNQKDHLVIITVSIGAIINLILDVIFIPYYGSMGAVIGLVGAECSIPLTQFLFLRREVKFGALLKISIPFVLSGVLMFAVVRITGILLGAGWITVIAEVAVGAAVYLTASFIFMKIGNPKLLESLTDELKKRVLRH